MKKASYFLDTKFFGALYFGGVSDEKFNRCNKGDQDSKHHNFNLTLKSS
jgi:hypothetical protein